MAFGKSGEHLYAQQILADVFDSTIRHGTKIEDQTQCTDLVVEDWGFQVGVRFREYPRYWGFRNQFTIRSSRPNGATTELAKILEGHVDFILYGFYAPAVRQVVEWTIIDLTVFRDFYQVVPQIHNPTETSFCAFHYSDFPPSLIFRRHLLDATTCQTIHHHSRIYQQQMSASLLRKYHALCHLQT